MLGLEDFVLYVLARSGVCGRRQVEVVDERVGGGLVAAGQDLGFVVCVCR